MSKTASHRVGTKVLFENDRVRVWEMRLAPGQSTERHTHQNDYLFVYVNAATVTLYPQEGDPETTEVQPMGVEYTEVGSGTTHRLENSGSSEHLEIIVELKGGSVASEPQEPETNF